MEFALSNFYITKPISKKYEASSLISAIGLAVYNYGHDVQETYRFTNITLESIRDEPIMQLGIICYDRPIEINIENINFIDISPNLELYFESASKLNIDSLTIRESYLLTETIIVPHNLDVVAVKNVVIENTTVIGSDNAVLMNWEYDSTFLLDGIQINNSNFIGRGSVFNFKSDLKQPLLISNIIVIDSIFEERSLFTVSKASEIGMQNISISGVSTNNSNANSVLDFSSDSSFNVDSVVIDNLKAKNSSIPLFSLKNKNLQLNLTQTVTISNIYCEGLYFDEYTSIINFGEAVTTGEFSITLSEAKFSNIYFEKGGNLMYFQHQTKNRLKVSNITILDVYNGGITVAPANLAIQTKVKLDIYNMTATNVDGQFRSLFELYTRADVKVYDSSFTQISTLDSGAVVYAGASNAKITLQDSIFANNTAIQGGVFLAESQSMII